MTAGEAIEQLQNGFGQNDELFDEYGDRVTGFEESGPNQVTVVSEPAGESEPEREIESEGNPETK
jgi:hypothetical protein